MSLKLLFETLPPAMIRAHGLLPPGGTVQVAERVWTASTAPDGAPMHVETGYWRPVRPGWVELVVAHPTGVAELAEGSLQGQRLELRTTSVSLTPTAKEVTVLERDLEVVGDVLRYELRMAAVGEPLTFHLAAELHRQPPEG